jgi:hypothetical protein
LLCSCLHAGSVTVTLTCGAADSCSAGNLTRHALQQLQLTPTVHAHAAAASHSCFCIG